MNRKILSLLLVIVMICTLLPVAAVADQDDMEEAGQVAVVVYGSALTKLLDKPDLTELKKSLQLGLAGESIPEMVITLTDVETGHVVQLQHEKNHSILESLKIESRNDTSKFKQLYSWITGFATKMANLAAKTMGFSELENYADKAYQFYVSPEVEAGKDYILKVEEINANGYTLNAFTARTETITVEEGIQFAGSARDFNANSINMTDLVFDNLEIILNKLSLKQLARFFVTGKIENVSEGDEVSETKAELIKKIIDKARGHSEFFETVIDNLIAKTIDINVEFPGIWLDRVEPGFRFTKTDLADKPLNDASFLMVDRNQTAKVVKAMMELGKDTFTNAMKLIGQEGYTWEDLSLLNAFLSKSDSTEEDQQTIGLTSESAQKLISTYWSLIEASATMPIKDFLKDEDLRVPALLKATSGENEDENEGVVFFNEESNITLVWSINVLLKIANVSNDWIQDQEAPKFENQELTAIMDVVFKTVKLAMAQGVEILDGTGELAKGFINDWIYPMLQNDDIPKTFYKIAHQFDTEEDALKLTWKDFIPNHAILTPKMPASDYILMEENAPKGYMRNPFFYTIHLTWNTEKEDVREWCYVTVADLGIIGPYLAENYYTFFRNNSFVSVADKILNNVIGKEDANVLNWALTTDKSVTAATLDYWAKMISANAAGESENSSEEAVANELTQYVIKHGNNAQSLMQFAYQVANRGRAVISSEVNEDWHFYNFNDSIHTSYATKITALLNGAKESLKEENDTLVSSAVKKAIDTQINIIGKVDAAITTATASFTAAVKDATAKVAESVKENVKATAKSVVSSLLKRLFK